MRLLVVTARYPTPDRPAAGAFVRDRLNDPSVVATVVAPSHYRGSGWLRGLRLLRAALTCKGRFDGVEGHFVLPSGPVALVSARLRRLPLVLFAHGGDVREMAQRHGANRWLARRVVRGADAVIANSADTARMVRELGGAATIVPPGIDLARFRPVPLPKRRRVLYLGGNVEHKGVAVARRLADTVLGPGIREVDPEEVPALMNAHSVLLVPSHAEPFGLVAVEAIASGRWVVASAIGGLLDIVQDGVNGTLVWDGDFASALAAVPNYDPRSVATTAARFAIEESRARVAAVWAEVIEGPGDDGSAPPQALR